MMKKLFKFFFILFLSVNLYLTADSDKDDIIGISVKNNTSEEIILRPIYSAFPNSTLKMLPIYLKPNMSKFIESYLDMDKREDPYPYSWSGIEILINNKFETLVDDKRVVGIHFRRERGFFNYVIVKTENRFKFISQIEFEEIQKKDKQKVKNSCIIL